MQLYRIAMFLWIAGTALIVLSWISVVTPTVGWTGFVISLVGAGLTWIQPSASSASSDPMQVAPVEPSGLDVGPDTKLEVGARVLAFSQGNWWRAWVVAIEDGGMVRVNFLGWDANLEYRVPRSELQLDPAHPASTDEGIRKGMPPQ